MSIALPSNALTTLDALADELGVDLDGVVDKRLARLIGVASDFIENYCDRQFGRAARTEYYRGFGMPRLWLNVRPLDISQPILVELDDQALELDADFVVDNAQLATLWRANGWERTAAYVPGAEYEALDGQEAFRFKITYTAGYVLPKDGTTGTPRTLPYDLEQVCLELIATKQAAKGRDRTIKSESLLSWSASYGGSDVTDSMRSVLAAYKKAVVF